MGAACTIIWMDSSLAGRSCPCTITTDKGKGQRQVSVHVIRHVKGNTIQVHVGPARLPSTRNKYGFIITHVTLHCTVMITPRINSSCFAIRQSEIGYSKLPYVHIDSNFAAIVCRRGNTLRNLIPSNYLGQAYLIHVCNINARVFAVDWQTLCKINFAGCNLISARHIKPPWVSRV